MFTAGRIMRSAQRPNVQRPSCSSPSGELLPGQSSLEAPEKVQLHLYNMPSANFHVYRQQQLELEKEKKSLLEAAATQQKQFYVPFIWQALLATIIGLIIISIGITLCVLGYEAENRQTSRKQILESRRTHQANKTRHVTNADDKITAIPRPVFPNNSSIKLSINCTRDCPKTSDQTTLDLVEENRLASEDSRLKYLIYLGPVIMSCGSFAIVFSCVVVCETRDRVLQLLEKRRKQLESMATGNNRQELLANIEQHLLSSSISLASNEDQTANELQSNINRDTTIQPSVGGEPAAESNQIHQSLTHPKLKIDVFTKSLIRSQLRHKLTALVETKLET